MFNITNLGIVFATLLNYLYTREEKWRLAESAPHSTSPGNGGERGRGERELNLKYRRRKMSTQQFQSVSNKLQQLNFEALLPVNAPILNDYGKGFIADRISNIYSIIKPVIFIFLFFLIFNSTFSQEYFSFSNLSENKVEKKREQDIINKLTQVESKIKVLDNEISTKRGNKTLVDSLKSEKKQLIEKKKFLSKVLDEIKKFFKDFLVSGNFNFNPNSSQDENVITPQIVVGYKKDFRKNDWLLRGFISSEVKLPFQTNDSNAALFHIFKAGSDVNIELALKGGYAKQDSSFAIIGGFSGKLNWLFAREFRLTQSDEFTYGSATMLFGIKLFPLVIAVQREFNFAKGDSQEFLKDNLQNSRSTILYIGIGTDTFQGQIKYLIESSKGRKITDVPEIKLGVTYSLF